MSDYAHAQVRSKASHDLSLEESVVVLTNPSSDPLLAYRTSLPVSLINDKIRRGELDSVRILGADQQQQSSFQSAYRTGLSPADVWFKTSIGAGGSKQIVVGSSPYVKDIGATLDLPQPIDLGLDDWRHKSVVTDLHPGLHTVETDAVFDLFATVTGFGIQAEFMLFPVSSRHLAKTSDGVLHGVVAQKIAGVHRIVHLWSGNGGETWGSEIVDPGAAFIEYYSPSITVDQFDGLHITYSTYDSVLGQFYCLFAGGATPAGWTLDSDVGYLFNNNCLMGSSSVGAFGADLDNHTSIFHQQEVGGHWVAGGAGLNDRAEWGTSHSTIDAHLDDASHLPPCRSMKVIRYDGFPSNIPVDAVLMFDTGVLPADTTRYSDQDGYFIRGGSTVGTLTGSLTHHHRFWGSLSGPHNGCLETFGGGSVSTTTQCNHGSHSWDVNGPDSDTGNNPPHYDIVLGKVTAPLSVLPQHSLPIFGAWPRLTGLLSGYFTKFSDAGGALEDQMFKGAVAYANGGGSYQHTHADDWFNTSGAGSTLLGIGAAGWPSSDPGHIHQVSLTYDHQYNYPNCYKTLIAHTDSDVSLSAFGRDLFYIYKPYGGVWTAPVNLSSIGKYYFQDQSVILVSPAGDLYVAWSAGGYNATPTLGAVVCREYTGGAWAAPVQVSADNVAESYPSMDIDGVNDVHFAWFDATNMNKMQYRKLSGGVLGGIENVDTTTYCGFPSNLVCDRNNVPHLVYQTWDSLVTYMADMVYSNRVGGTWSVPIAITNKRALSYDQDNGQVYFDNKGNLVINWSGQGWGSYPTKYGLMRRYVTPGGTIVPPIVSDPYIVLAENKDIMSPWVFWHQFPLTSGVYHNYPVQGLTTFCLYDVHVDGKTSDMVFFTSDDANVGDASSLGSGGSGDSDITPGGVSGESVLQKKTYTQSLRSHIGDSSISRSLRNSSFR